MKHKDYRRLPYGMFTTTDGLHVIFDRSYRLLFEQVGRDHIGGMGAWKAVSEQRRLDLQKKLTIWFYDDVTPIQLVEKIGADWLRRVKVVESKKDPSDATTRRCELLGAMIQE